MDQLWYDPHLELHIGTAIQRDGYVYISRGYNGPVLMTAVELKTGKIMWQERGFRQGATAVGGRQADPGRSGWHAGALPGDSPEVRSAFEGFGAAEHRLDAAHVGGHAALPAGPEDDNGAGIGERIAAATPI